MGHHVALRVVPKGPLACVAGVVLEGGVDNALKGRWRCFSGVVMVVVGVAVVVMGVAVASLRLPDGDALMFHRAPCPGHSGGGLWDAGPESVLHKLHPIAGVVLALNIAVLQLVAGLAKVRCARPALDERLPRPTEVARGHHQSQPLVFHMLLVVTLAAVAGPAAPRARHLRLRVAAGVTQVAQWLALMELKRA
jgi:hypothetical protein